MHLSKLVSVIIPCFNAEMWLPEAIDSCLQQTYPNIEIIIIDDGSTDHSLEIIKSYENKVIWETRPNQGGNYARNRGFTLSKGVYIQFLDADDYMLPEKIEFQVRCLEGTQADVVYGDWRYKYHLNDGTTFLDKINVCGPKDDFLESLLADEKWVSPNGFVFTRDAIEKSEGWDESLQAGQDRDFLISLAINGANFVYQSGCHSIYRRYGNITVSTSSDARWLTNHCLLMEKAEAKLSELNQLSPKYCHALARSYFQMARKSLRIGNKRQYLQFLAKVLMLCPNFKTNSKKPIYNFMQSLLGFTKTEELACFMLVNTKKLADLNKQFFSKNAVILTKRT